MLRNANFSQHMTEGLQQSVTNLNCQLNNILNTTQAIGLFFGLRMAFPFSPLETQIVLCARFVIFFHSCSMMIINKDQVISQNLSRNGQVIFHPKIKNCNENDLIPLILNLCRVCCL